MTEAIQARDWDEASEPYTSPSNLLDDGSRRKPGRMRETLMRAAGWSMIGYLLLQVLRIASSLVLTRLLVPEMFGIMAVVTTVQVAIVMISDLGLRPAAIQSYRGDDQSYLDTVWTLQIAHGCILWLACTVIAFLIDYAASSGMVPTGSVYAVDELPALLIATAFSMVISGLQSTKLISAVRNINLGRVTLIEIVAQIASLTLAVVLAWLTGSIWSFVASTLLSCLTVTVLSHIWLPGTMNRLAWDRSAATDLVRFGRWIMLSSALSVVAASSDRFLLAMWLTPTMLGLYMLAFNLVALLEGAGDKLFSTVAMPALSKVAREQPERLQSTFLKMRLPFDLMFVGSAGAIYAAGQLVSEVLYDQRYHGAGSIIQILSFSLLTARYGTLASIYLVLNEPKNYTILNFVRAVSVIISLPVAYHLFGLEGALWTVSLHGLSILPVVMLLNARHQLNNFRYEAIVLLVWPLGFCMGHALNMLFHSLSVRL